MPQSAIRSRTWKNRFEDETCLESAICRRTEIIGILDTAENFREISTREIKKVPTLRGKTVINLFFESSTRTRTSFELAAKRLSADAVNISVSSSSVSKGETLLDTALNLDAMAPDCIVVRHSSAGVPHQLAKVSQAAIVNAGDGANEHPTQALLDAMTIREHKKKIKGLKVAIVGDILHSRVARSNIHLLTKLGAKVRVAGPGTLVPQDFQYLIDQGETDNPKSKIQNPKLLEVMPHIEDAIEGADVVMILRIQRERQDSAYFPTLARIRDPLRPDQRTARSRKKGRDRPAPGPDESRYRDLVGRRRQLAFADSRSGKIRRRGSNGGTLSRDRRNHGKRA